MKNWRNAGRKTKKYYYKKSIIKNGKLVIPEIITEDYSFEMQFGIEEKHITEEQQYLKYKK
jgi:hypothetical protein|tara:strand:+ start:5011 stop:5193 length:183 start_codon:yes stop_codon:yes gene_type:complete